jgi:hypothetical protein
MFISFSHGSKKISISDNLYEFHRLLDKIHQRNQSHAKFEILICPNLVNLSRVRLLSSDWDGLMN